MRYNVPLRFAGYVPSLAIFLMAWLPAGAQTAKEIYNFPASDAPNLVNSLVATKGATFYGSTLGVQLVNAGVIFSVSPASGGALVETVIYTFPLSDGAAFGSCYSTIGISGSGDLYGTAVSDGSYGMGSVFRLSPPAAAGGRWTYTTLYSFTGGSDSAQPVGGVVMGKKGDLYGATYGQGFPSQAIPGAYGSIFKLSPPATGGGEWKLTTLYAFTGGTDGANPASGLTAGPNGGLFGTTVVSAPVSGGTVFELAPPGQTGGGWAFTKLHQFGPYPDGSDPTGSLSVGPNGNLYGTTYGGGKILNGGFYGGTAFALYAPTASRPAWGYEIVHDFGASGDCMNLTLGIALGNGGVLYGVNAGCPAYTLTPPAQTGGPWVENFIALPSITPSVKFFHVGPRGLLTATTSGGAHGSGGIVEVVE
jgi:uncharacterized repeat protein (TIGR03803 family)